MERCLGTVSSTGSVVVRDSTVQGVMPESLESLGGRNLVNICQNGARKESVGIYTKSRCQWSSCLIKTKLGQGR